MNLDELQSVQSRERQTDSLQHLGETFYADAAAFIQDLRGERDAAAERADNPLDSPEVRRLSNDIRTAERTVEAIYERRVGKVVKMASFAAADMPTDDEGLTAEERDLYEQLVADIEDNREGVLDVLAGEDGPDGANSTDVDAGSASRSVAAGESSRKPGPTDAAAADAGSTAPGEEAPPDAPTSGAEGAVGEAADETADEAADEAVGRAEAADGSGSPTADGGTTAGTAGPAEAPAAGGTESAAPGTPARADDVARATVRITRDVGEILGVDERAYDLSAEDVVTLPEPNAKPLLDRDAAERID